MSVTDPCPDSSDSKKNESKMKILWLGFPVILLIWVGYYYFQSPLDKDSPFDRLNTLFSGLAFWGLVFAILLQKSELALQRNELELTRREVRGQKEQLEAQNRTLKQQRFENTFFSLLNLFNSIVNSIEITRSRMVGEAPETLASGRDCFATFSREFGHNYSTQRKEHSDRGERILCVTAYEEFVGHRQALVGHYFRTLYNIVKFIATSEVENKQTYINILRAQLSSSELTLLFYNCISKYGSEKFKPLVERFGLLENMDFSSLLDPKHRELFNERAFHSPP
jgi:Putative phage abortive infection protein